MRVVTNAAKHDLPVVPYWLALVLEFSITASCVVVGGLILLSIWSTYACLATIRYIGWKMGLLDGAPLAGKLRE